MSPATPNDDPTRALDDFVRRMRPAAQPPAAADTDLADLPHGLRAFIASEREATFARFNADYAWPPGSGAVRRR